MGKRSAIIEKLNPLEGKGTLRWIQDGGNIYGIAAYVENLEFPGGNARGNGYQTVQLSLLAEDPRWYDPNINTLVLTEGDNLVTNTGTTSTPFELILEGPISNPTISNVTIGEDFKINYNLNLGDKLKIYSDFGNKRVIYINSAGEEISAFSLLDLDSKLFYLLRGDNMVNIQAGGVTGDTHITLNYYNRFLGG